MKTKCFIYARKSTEDEERQIMSIEAQITEINDFARREGLQIADTFIESKSAKKPGRAIFNEMIEKIYASEEPVTILAWHPDRLARNSVDGGQIIYLVDIDKICGLKFPTFWFEPTPQGLFMLQVAFGQSKYYSDNLSENVKRGIRQKLRRGEYPCFAPVGYVNNAKTRNIDTDPVKAKIIKRAFEEYAQGRHSLESMRHRLSFWGLVSGTGKALVKSSVHRILTNITYTGLIHHKGETYEGRFEAVVDKATFDVVQGELKKRSQPRIQKDGHNFPFVGLFKCGECGGMVTAQYAKQRRYIYYRCSKKRGNCSQSYLRSDLLIEQLRVELEKVALSEGWADWMMGEIERRQAEDMRGQRSFSQNLKKQIADIEIKLDKLINAFLDGMVEKDTYLQKKDELLSKKIELTNRLRDFGKKGDAWVEPARGWVETAHQAGKLALSDDFVEIKHLVKKIGSNRLLVGKKVQFDFVPPFNLLPKYKSLQKKSPAPQVQGTDTKKGEKRKGCMMSGWGDSNSRPPRPERGALTGLRYTPDELQIDDYRLQIGYFLNQV